MKYKIIDGSYSLGIRDGKLEHIFGISLRPFVWTIVASEMCLPADNSFNPPEAKIKYNDTIVVSEIGLVVFIKKIFLKPIKNDYKELLNVALNHLDNLLCDSNIPECCSSTCEVCNEIRDTRKEADTFVRKIKEDLNES